MRMRKSEQEQSERCGASKIEQNFNQHQQVLQDQRKENGKEEEKEGRTDRKKQKGKGTEMKIETPGIEINKKKMHLDSLRKEEKGRTS